MPALSPTFSSTQQPGRTRAAVHWIRASDWLDPGQLDSLRVTISTSEENDNVGNSTVRSPNCLGNQLSFALSDCSDQPKHALALHGIRIAYDEALDAGKEGMEEATIALPTALIDIIVEQLAKLHLSIDQCDPCWLGGRKLVSGKDCTLPIVQVSQAKVVAITSDGRELSINLASALRNAGGDVRASVAFRVQIVYAGGGVGPPPIRLIFTPELIVVQGSTGSMMNEAESSRLEHALSLLADYSFVSELEASQAHV